MKFFFSSLFIIHRSAFIILFLVPCSLFIVFDSAFAEGNIDSSNKYAWAENAGWVNFAPKDSGVTVSVSGLSGYAWAENIGWIKLGSDNGPPYENSTTNNWGVNVNKGALSGYAWSENCGWINFNPEHSQVVIDPGTGKFEGYAWAENVGWVHFKNTSPYYNVRTTGSVVPRGTVFSIY